MRSTTAWTNTRGTTDLELLPLKRRDLRDDDIAVQIDYCGVCHSDLHAIAAIEGLVPGHEFVGTVTETGPAATRHAVGDKVAIGTVVDSCGACRNCLKGEEIYCLDSWTPTYGGLDRVDGAVMQGGYSREYVLNERFAFPLPDGLAPESAAPLMCAGITVWAPLRKANVGPGSRVAVAGLGGLGHLAVKFAVALGAEVTVISTTADKKDAALALGAKDFILTTASQDAEGAAPMEAKDFASIGKENAENNNRFDLIVDTIPFPHNLDAEILMLDLDGELSLVGLAATTPVNNLLLLIGRKSLSSSAAGGVPATAEMLAFAAQHGIAPDVEIVPSSQVKTALDRLEANDVRFRFVLDLSDLD
ncbi:NAD(P)-dependent alcohol dehydrogenase [Streptomyces sp. Tue6028]|uniref:NAD(P)-dependent alcohol dehydrogenase n=1 Tax=Streptomyces sp. Tue6028 TaxID=2036037 RepID=UPI003D75B23F